MGAELRQLRAAGFLGKSLDDIGYFSGKLDDFAYNAITQDFFKPLVLLSGSYAWHISLAELIPNTLRLGLLNMTRSLAHNFGDRLGIDVEPGEEKALLGSIVQTMGDDGQELNRLAVEDHIHRLFPDAEVRIHHSNVLHTIGVYEREDTSDHLSREMGTINWSAPGAEDLPASHSWHAEVPGEVQMIKVADRYQRQGLASALYDAARQLHVGSPDEISDPAHSPYRTDEGREWVRYMENDRPRTPLTPSAARAAQPVSERQIRMESEIAIDLITEGHKLTKAVNSGDNISKEYADSTRARQAFRDLFSRSHGSYTTNDFKMTEPGQDDYLNHWRDSIREANQSPESLMALKAYKASIERGVPEEKAVLDAGRVATSELKKLSPEELDMYQRNKLYSEHWYSPERRIIPPKADGTPWEPIDDWGQEIAQNMRALLGRTHANPQLMEHMSYGTTPSIHRLADIVDQDEWPVAVKGRIKAPAASGVMQHIADTGFRHAINPFVNWVSRKPLFRIEFYNQWKQLRPMVENGIYDLDEAMAIAADRATAKSVSFVHNLHDRSQISETLRNWLPFYFAQEQAYRRMGRLLAEDPGAFRRYQMLISGIGKMAASGTSGVNGDKYYLIPGGTFLSMGAASIFSKFDMPVVNVNAGQIQTSLSSANVIFPLSSGFRPDLSPVAALAAKLIYGMAPELGPDLSKLVGTQPLTSPLWTMLVPNTLAQRLLEATPVPGIGQEFDRTYVSSMNQAIQLAAFQQTEAVYAWIKGGRKGPEPQIIPPDAIAGASSGGGAVETQDQQRFINRIKNQTTILFLTNAMLSFFSPSSTTPSVQDFGFTKEVNADIAKYGSVTKGVTEFLLAHPLATPYTVWQSYSSSGATIQATAPSENWINGHQKFINKYPNAAFFMMPNLSGQYDYSIYNEQLAQGIRVKRSPQEFLNALYVSAGNAAYYPELAAYEQVANAANSTSATREAAYNTFQAWLQPFQATHPIWSALGPLNASAKDATMTQAISQIGQMVTAHEVPNNSQAQKVVSLYNAYLQFNAEFYAANAAHNYAAQQREIKQNWRNYLDAVKTKNPDLEETISAVFEDALGVTTAGETSGNQG
jgi:GNAT superfamily N-acetyltransferase